MMKCLLICSDQNAKLIEVQFQNLEGMSAPIHCTDVKEASKLLLFEKPDLVLLELELSGAHAFMRAHNLTSNLVALSKNGNDAAECYDLNVVDYLRTPLSTERFAESIEKVQARIASKINVPIEQPQKDYFFVRADHKFEKISRQDILYIEGMQNYITIQTETKKVITYSSLKSIESYLPENEFLRVQRSFIIQISKVDSIDGEDLIIGKTRIAISRNIKEAVLKTILSDRFYKYQA